MYSKSKSYYDRQFLPGIASAAFLRSESHGTHEHSLLSMFSEAPPTWRTGFLYIFSQEQGSPVIPPGIGLTPVLEVEVEVNLRPTVGQSVLVSGTHLGPATNFSFSLKFPLDSCEFVIL
jgi:hypothetical protein